MVRAQKRYFQRARHRQKFYNISALHLSLLGREENKKGDMTKLEKSKKRLLALRDVNIG